MKNARQTTILNNIANKDVETQEELASELRSMGINVTQATVSRDIKELRLVKILGKNGYYKYAAAEKSEKSHNDRFVRMFVDSVLSITYANNIIVIKTLSGSANVAAEAIDSMEWEEILGTMAGDNTILVIVRTNAETPYVVDRFKEILH
ncbi:MAG: arginine repressor [Clostridiales bacterium]|nr:arginine repressor [Clostridiales bacterium]